MFEDNWKSDKELTEKIESIILSTSNVSSDSILPLVRTQICISSDDIIVTIPQTFDKSYYSAMEFCRSIGKQDNSSNIHKVSFNVSDVSDISFLSACLGDRPNYYNPEQSIRFPELLTFLNNNHSIYVLSEKLRKLFQDCGKSPSVFYASPVVTARNIVNGFRKQYKLRVDNIYNGLLEDGKIPVKWKSEYQLYVLVKSRFSDSRFQYSPSWLTPQSLDIYIPCINTAIEYQGKQHYEPIDYFGGDEAFRKGVFRDLAKADKCNENGVNLLYWKYDLPISESNLVLILSKQKPPYL